MSAAFSKFSFLLVLKFCFASDLYASSKTYINETKRRHMTNLMVKMSRDDMHNIDYLGHYKTGSKYKINNKSLGKTQRVYKPLQHVKRYSEVGIASWYGKKNHGNITANGDIFNSRMLTAAHPLLPMPCMVRVDNLRNNRSIILMVNDRGPFRRERRVIDVSERAARILGFKKQGIASVRVTYLNLQSKMLLKRLMLEPKHGFKPKVKNRSRTCSVNCYIKLVNVRNNLMSIHDAIR